MYVLGVGADGKCRLKVRHAPHLARPSPPVCVVLILLKPECNETTQYTGATDSVELSAKEIVVPVVGWIVTFPSESASTQKAPAEGNSSGVVAGIQSDFAMWSWWVWLIYALLLACIVLPICCIICRR